MFVFGDSRLTISMWSTTLKTVDELKNCCPVSWSVQAKRTIGISKRCQHICLKEFPSIFICRKITSLVAGNEILWGFCFSSAEKITTETYWAICTWSTALRLWAMREITVMLMYMSRPCCQSKPKKHLLKNARRAKKIVYVNLQNEIWIHFVE